MRYAAFLLPLRRELKFGEVGGGSSRARRTLPRRGKPCQGQGKVNCVEPRTSLFLWLPLTRSRADVRARSEAESFAPQGQALSGARESKLCGAANLSFFVAAPDPLSGRRSCSERGGELCPVGASPVRGSHDCRRKGCKTKNHEKQCVFHGFLLFKWQK